MIENAAAANALATVGAVIWTIQIIPQVVKSYRTKSTKGLSVGLMGAWAISSPPFAAYVVAQHLPIPLQVQPHAFGFLSALSAAQCLYYSHGYSKMHAGLLLLVFSVVAAGFEVGSVYALWMGQRRGTEVPLLIYGYFSVALTAAGFIPQYWEIYRLREVMGISLIFMAVDITGGLFNISSLFFRQKLDIAAFVSYLLVVVLDAVVLILAWILNPKRNAERATAALVQSSNEGSAVTIEQDKLPETPMSLTESSLSYV